MHDVRPGYFYRLGFLIDSVTHLRNDVPSDLRIAITSHAFKALEMFISNEVNKEMLPQSHKKALLFVTELRLWDSAIYPGRTVNNYEDLRRVIEGFSTTLIDELENTHNYVVTDKGNLSVARLVDGASKRYAPDVLSLLDTSITNEIDDAGRCLAFTQYTACGFHLLRSVEIAIKAYIHAANGSLPKNRNWGEYIVCLETAKASKDLVDLVRILKAKRNPLMHPQDRLTEADAIDIFCICQAVTGVLIDDVKVQQLDSKFSASLAVLPTMKVP